MANYTPNHEEITGASLGGSTGATGRTYTLANTSSTEEMFTVIVEGAILQQGTHYSLANDVLTFNVSVWNEQAITLDYFTTTGGDSVGTDYCTASDVAQELGLRYSFSGSTTPTETQVNNMINQVESRIDTMLNRSWRSITVTDEYYHIEPDNFYRVGAGIRINLKHRNIRTMTSGTDKIEIWNGNSYEEWVASKTEGRDDDFWLDYGQGILFLRTFSLSAFDKPLRLTYRHGASVVPPMVEELAAKMVAIKILTNEDKSSALDETGSGRNMAYDPRISVLKSSVRELMFDLAEPYAL